MTDDEVLRYLQDLQRQRSVIDARMTQAMAHFHKLRQDYADGKYASDEVAAALRWSPRTASSMVSDAVQLVERLPETVRELESGRLGHAEGAGDSGLDGHPSGGAGSRGRRHRA